MLKDKPELKVIVVDGEVIKYYLERKTTLYSKIRYKDGIITVVIPTFLKDNELESFVSKHIGKFAKRIEKKNETELININDNKIALFGIPYTIKIIKGAKNKYELLGKKLYLTLTNDSKKKEVIKNFLKDNSCD
jgi:predicted metal-dependent hydrolase